VSRCKQCSYGPWLPATVRESKNSGFLHLIDIAFCKQCHHAETRVSSYSPADQLEAEFAFRNVKLVRVETED